MSLCFSTFVAVPALISSLQPFALLSAWDGKWEMLASEGGIMLFQGLMAFTRTIAN